MVRDGQIDAGRQVRPAAERQCRCGRVFPCAVRGFGAAVDYQAVRRVAERRSHRRARRPMGAGASRAPSRWPATLALVAAVGDDLNERAWTQIADALGTIEYDERGTAGHAAFAAYARAALRPVYREAGLASKGGRDAWRAALAPHRDRRSGRLGRSGNYCRGAAPLCASLSRIETRYAPDEQAVVLSIVARYADAATFAQLHEVAKSARNETELRRYYTALMQVRDPQLAAAADQDRPLARKSRRRPSRCDCGWCLRSARRTSSWPGMPTSEHLDCAAGPAPAQWPPVYRPVQSGNVLAFGAARQVGELGQGAPAGGNGAGPGARHGNRPIQGWPRRRC